MFSGIGFAIDYWIITIIFFFKYHWPKLLGVTVLLALGFGMGWVCK